MKSFVAVLIFSLCCGFPILAGAQDAAATASGEAAQKCKVPARPEIPNGRSATEDEMIGAQKSLKEYLATGDAYLACLDKMRSEWGETATPEQVEIYTLLYNRMVDEMQSTGDLFNQSVRAFKGKRGS